MRKEDDPSLSLPPSPGHAAAEPGTCLDAGQDSAPGSGLDARYEQLADPGSFEEVGQLAGGIPAGGDGRFLPDAYVGGLAKIDGREVAIGGEDFTVRTSRLERPVHGSGYERIASPGCSDRTIRRRLSCYQIVGIR
jgi:hypothetical protein